MIIIPEIRTIVLQPPRTGTSTLRRALLDRYPHAMSLYRHMERDGIPAGYETWRMFCQVRHPFERLRSLYAYMRNFKPTGAMTAAGQAVHARLKADTDRAFVDWLERSTETFSNPRLPDGGIDPYGCVRTRLPIARKSLWHWARPDLGPVEFLPLENIRRIETLLDIRMGRLNASDPLAEPLRRCPRVQAHLDRHFAWDLALYRRFAGHAARPASSGALCQDGRTAPAGIPA